MSWRDIVKGEKEYSFYLAQIEKIEKLLERKKKKLINPLLESITLKTVKNGLVKLIRCLMVT